MMRSLALVGHFRLFSCPSTVNQTLISDGRCDAPWKTGIDFHDDDLVRWFIAVSLGLRRPIATAIEVSILREMVESVGRSIESGGDIMAAIVTRLLSLGGRNI